MMTTEKKTLLVSLPLPLYEKVKSQSAEIGFSMTDIVRLALSMYFERLKVPEKSLS